MIVTGDLVVAYVEQKIGRKIHGPLDSLGLTKDNKIVVGAVFNNYEVNEEIEVTLAAERGAITRQFLRAVGEYVRDTNNCFCLAITTKLPEVIDIVERLGGQVDGRREYAPGKFKYFLSINRDNWKL